MYYIKTLFMLAAALTAISGPLAADGVSVTTVVHGRPELEPVLVRLHAVRTDGTDSPIERMISVPGSETLDLPQGAWELSIESALFWSAPLVASGSQPVSLDLWPVGILRGTMKGEPRGLRLGELRVNFAPAVENSETGLPAGEAACSIEKEHWRCLLPEGKYDLRLLSRGFAMEFRWNQEIREGEELDLGQLTLRSGASMHGFVAIGRGAKADMKEVVIAAKPRSLSARPPPRSYTADANGRGFFQIAGLPPGEYLVSAEAKHLRSEQRPVTIIEGRTAELRSPLRLEPPRKIVVTITSPFSAEEIPWHIRLYVRVTDTNRMEEVRSSVSRNGEGWSSEVVPGQYVLKVGQADGSIWSSTELDVDTTDVFLNLSIPVVRVGGIVKLGAFPLPHARLIFGGAWGSVRQTLVTDGDGIFSGEIPSRNNLPEKWHITIEADDPRVQRTSDYEAVENSDGDLRFDIEIRRTIVKGRVVNEDGSSATGSIVSLQSADDKVFEQAFPDSDGSFELFGFEPGAYRIHADAFQRSSDVMRIQVSETDTPAIEIVLKQDVLVRGRVLSRSSGVAGARLTALQRDVRTVFVPGTTTDGNGNFELQLPPLTRAYDVVVLAPGFALASGRAFVRDDKIVTITVHQNGGSLAVEIPSGGEAIIVHAGAEFQARWLTTLSGGSIETRDEWDLATLPAVESGEYSVCVKGRCRTGIVTPHGTLLLSLRSDD